MCNRCSSFEWLNGAKYTPTVRTQGVRGSVSDTVNSAQVKVRELKSNCNESYAPIWIRVTASIIIKQLINIRCNYRFSVCGQIESNAEMPEIEFSFSLLVLPAAILPWRSGLTDCRHTFCEENVFFEFWCIVRFVAVFGFGCRTAPFIVRLSAADSHTLEAARW